MKWVMLKDRYKQIQADTSRYKQIRPDTSRYKQIRPDTNRYKQIQLIKAKFKWNDTPLGAVKFTLWLYMHFSWTNHSYHTASMSMLSQKSRYKVDFISTYLGLVVDAKKLVNMSDNRLLDNKRLIKIRLFSKRWMKIQVCWVNAESKKGICTKWISFLHI